MECLHEATSLYYQEVIQAGSLPLSCTGHPCSRQIQGRGLLAGLLLIPGAAPSPQRRVFNRHGGSSPSCLCIRPGAVFDSDTSETLIVADEELFPLPR